MISPFELYVALIALYLVECLRVTKPADLLVARETFGRFGIKKPIAYPAEGRWGWVFLNAVRPDGPVFALHTAGAHPAARGAFLAGAAGEAPRLTPYAEIATSEEIAEHERLAIESLKALPEAKRVPAIEKQIAASLDTKSIRDHVASLKSRTLPLRVLTVAQLGWSFFGLIPLWLALAETTAVLVFLAVLYASGIAAAILHWRLNIRRGVGTAIKFSLYPISSIRALDEITLEQLGAFHPAAVAAVLCGPSEAAKLISAEIVRWKYSVDDAGADWLEVKARHLAALEKFAKANQLPTGPLLSAPPRSDATSKSYCPQCRAQYTFAGRACPDCRVILLQPLQEARRG